ncbi:MAG: rod shape-determining protein [Oscillospiraceae bacterium]|jgi:rod shape-determining protein MreB|nr:rod shape-determining protein [Oscillospiraceae bacterium]
MSIFSRDLGIDLGTSNVLIFAAGKGIVLREPSVVALDKNTGKVLKVGADARNMLGRTPGNVAAIHPLKDGAISDYAMTAQMLTQMISRVVRHSIVKPRMILSVPSGITEVEERAVIQAAMEAGARRVYLIEEPLAAALGAQMDISAPNGHMVVDIGGGTTDIGVLTMNGIAHSASIKIAGIAFDEAIIKFVRKYHGIVIGSNKAEELKMSIGCVCERPDSLTMKVKGRDVKTGLASEVTVTSEEMLDALKRPARQIADQVLDVLEETSPELVADIAGNGIVLTGGCSQIWGMDRLLQERTEIRCMVADDADSCVAYGCGKSLSWMNHMQEGTINLARRRLLKDG